MSYQILRGWVDSGQKAAGQSPTADMLSSPKVVAPAAAELAVPRLEQHPAGDAVVTRWGEIDGFLFRPGDRLLLGEALEGGLVVLLPRGWGHPMLGRRTRKGLVAEPGGVPASEARWRVAGGLSCVERPVERVAGSKGAWWVSARIEEIGPPGAVGGVEEARQVFLGGRMEGAELDAFCLQAALAPERFGVRVAVGAAADAERAAELVFETPTGMMRVDPASGPSREARGQRVLVGPWPSVQETEARREPTSQLPLFAGGKSVG
jgi:hypothetical protein